MASKTIDTLYFYKTISYHIGIADLFYLHFLVNDKLTILIILLINMLDFCLTLNIFCVDDTVYSISMN